MMNYLTEKDLAQLANKHKLFVKGWQMENVYEYILQGATHFGLHVIIEHDIPVASCIVDKEEGIVNVFVKEDYRSKKYGQRVVEETFSRYQLDKSEFYGSEGIDGSEKFYNSCNLAYFKTGYLSMNQEEAKLYIENKINMKEIRKKRVQDYWNKNMIVNCKLKM